MPIITQYNPWEVGLNAGGEAMTAMRDRKDKDAAANALAAKTRYDQMAKDRDYAHTESEDAIHDTIEQQRAEREQAAAVDQHTTSVQNLQIAKDQEDTDKVLRPLAIKLQLANVALTQQKIPVEKANAQKAQAMATVAKIEASLKAKYGAATAAAMLQKTYAGIMHENASTAHEEAGTAHEQMETAEGAQRLASGKDTYHAPSGGGADLSDAGAAVYQQIINTPGVDMKTGIAMANKAHIHPKERLQIIRELNQAGLETDRTRLADQRADDKFQLGAREKAAAATAKSAGQFLGIIETPGSKFMDLPATARVKFNDVVHRTGLYGPPMLDALSKVASGAAKSASFTQDEAASYLNALQ